MSQIYTKKALHIMGMTCTGCETRIENRLSKIQGISSVKAIYSTSTLYVTYDDLVVDIDEIYQVLEKLGYQVGTKKQTMIDTKESKKTNQELSINQLLGIGIILFALYLIIKNTVGFNFIPEVSANMGYGLLFVVGLLTSLHCIAMCGGINLSQCVTYKTDESTSKLAVLKPSLMYNAGRVVSYTVIGGIVGALGSVVSFSGWAKGIVAILSGIFMVIMGINMLGLFPSLRKFMPRMPKAFARKVHNQSNRKTPFYVGLLNGLMPCGPLQAMQLYALGTGSFIAGASSMFFFSLGTVPLMFGFGAISSFLGGKFTHRLLKVSAVLVMVLGVLMVNRGLNLSGITMSYASQGSSNTAKIEDNVQTITTKLTSGSYTPIVVQKGIPVKWTIQAEESDLNGCNNPVTIPKLNIEKKLVPGDNLIEFTPKEEGTMVYTCWMGMISSTIQVVSDINNVSPQSPASLDNSNTLAQSGNGGCCAAGANATKFYNGNIPTDDIQIGKMNGDIQEVTITVNDQGYSPAVVVVKKGVKTKIKFIAEKLNSCNNIVDFPEYEGRLNLQKGQLETPELVPEADFTFQCWMGMLHGYVKVVDDPNTINMEELKQEIQNYKPASGGQRGCH